MNMPLTSEALAKALLQRLLMTLPFKDLDSHLSTTDSEVFDTIIDADCVLRIRARTLGGPSNRSYSASLALAYPSTELVYDDLWSVQDRMSSDRYFPLACSVSELTDVPVVGLPAGVGAADLLASKLAEASYKHVWPIRTRSAAVTEMMRGPSSPWYSRLAYENWLPVALFLEQDAQRARAVVQRVLAQQDADESSRAVACRSFLAKLAQRGVH